MKRNEAREQAFILIFGECFNSDLTPEEMIENAKDAENYVDDVFSMRLVSGVKENKEAIDKIIEENLNKWKIGRLPKTTLAILRIGVYEILYCDDVPDGVSINEAVELAKRFGNDGDYSFVNGILGKIARNK